MYVLVCISNKKATESGSLVDVLITVAGVKKTSIQLCQHDTTQ